MVAPLCVPVPPLSEAERRLIAEVLLPESSVVKHVVRNASHPDKISLSVRELDEIQQLIGAAADAAMNRLHQASLDTLCVHLAKLAEQGESAKRHSSTIGGRISRLAAKAKRFLNGLLGAGAASPD
ncbi:MAG: hypothetical protein NTW19_11610 [Planctomycetota bacterium]|nr:hypothetical protein [Planctomycetota bacterium]